MKDFNPVNSFQLQLCQPKHNLTDEEIRIYLNVSYNIIHFAFYEIYCKYYYVFKKIFHRKL